MTTDWVDFWLAWAGQVIDPSLDPMWLMCWCDLGREGKELSLAPFWTFGVAALMRDLHPDEVDRAVFARVMAPFVDVCGDLPEELR